MLEVRWDLARPEMQLEECAFCKAGFQERVRQMDFEFEQHKRDRDALASHVDAAMHMRAINT